MMNIASEPNTSNDNLQASTAEDLDDNSKIYDEINIGKEFNVNPTYCTDNEAESKDCQVKYYIRNG